MRKIFIVENLCCANCAAKIEAAISRLPGVEMASLNFISGKMAVVAEDSVFDGFLALANETAKKIESDCVITEK